MDVLNSSDCGTTGISKATSPLSIQAFGSRHAIICTRIGSWPQRTLIAAANIHECCAGFGHDVPTSQKKTSSYGTRIKNSNSKSGSKSQVFPSAWSRLSFRVDRARINGSQTDRSRIGTTLVLIRTLQYTSVVKIGIFHGVTSL